MTETQITLLCVYWFNNTVCADDSRVFDLKHLQQVFPVKRLNHKRGKQRGIMIVCLPGADPGFAVGFCQLFSKQEYIAE